MSFLIMTPKLTVEMFTSVSTHGKAEMCFMEKIQNKWLLGTCGSAVGVSLGMNNSVGTWEFIVNESIK